MPNLYAACRRLALAFVLLMSVSQNSLAMDLTIGENLQLGDNLQSAEAKLKEFCGNITVLDTASPLFPLAANKEQHLICDQYKDSYLAFGKAVLVIADDQFVQMEAIDVSVTPIKSALGETSSRYLDMNIYSKGTYWLDEKNKRFVWLHEDAKHPNLFSWHNPYLTDSEFQPPNALIEIPALLDFDQNLEELEPLFFEQCSQTRKERHDKVWLPNKPEVQIQINCFGYRFAGFERKMEAVFGDGSLQLVWILTAKAEEQRLRELLVNRWGAPEIHTDKWEVYNEGRISLRKDKPELLVLSDQMIPLYRSKMESEEED